MFLHQGAKIFINSMDTVTNVTPLKTINILKIPACSIATIPTKRTGKYNTSTYMLEVETIYMEDKTEPEQVPLTFINLLHDTAQVAKHTLIAPL